MTHESILHKHKESNAGSSIQTHNTPRVPHIKGLNVVSTKFGQSSVTEQSMVRDD